jgi:aminocarboxymuconate-semialdehyde decarboxylase
MLGLFFSLFGKSAETMFYTCSSSCQNPAHQHALIAGASGLLASPPKAASKGRSSPQKPSAEAAKVVVPKRATSAKVVDVHCHYLSPEVGAKYAHLQAAKHDATAVYATELSRQVNLLQIQQRGAKFNQVEVRLKDMDKMGIDIQVVSPAPIQYFYFTEAVLGAQISRDINESIARVVAQRPDRFVGMGTIPLQDVALAIQELEYAVNVLGMRGVQICTNVNGKNLTDPALKLEAFFAKAQSMGIVLFLHPMGFSQGERFVEHYFNNVMGNPLETSLALGHLIFDGVLARYPKLKILASHGGGYIASYWARMDHAWKARADARTVIQKKPSSYLEKIHFDTITHDAQILGNLVERYGAQHVLLGTDYPFDMGEDKPVQLIESVHHLSAEDRALIKGGNAMKLFKIKA